MSRLFLGNFNFEHQLAALPKSPGPMAVARIAAELSSAWLGMAQANDAVWMPEIPDADFPADMVSQGFPQLHWIQSIAELGEVERNSSLELYPWGWSLEAVEWAEKQGLRTDPPPLHAVREANSRRFSFGLERELDLGLKQAVELATIEDCVSSLQSYATESRWVIKSEFGMSARERLLGRGPNLLPNQIAWAQKRFEAGLHLFWEPWVQSLGEAGLQFEVPKSGRGEPYCVGITPLLTDDVGTYRGSRFDLSKTSSLDWSPALEAGLLAASRAQALGYFGPLGIDAMWYLDQDQTPKLRPLQDINARWTMGRLSLGFRSLLNPGEAGAWVHLRSPVATIDSSRDWWNQLGRSLPNEVLLLRTSPLTLGGKAATHAMAVVIAPDEERLQRAIEKALHAN